MSLLLSLFLCLLTIPDLRAHGVLLEPESSGVIIPKDYKKDLPPELGHHPLPVQLILKIHKIQNHDESPSITLEVSIHLSWKDNRLRYNEEHDWESFPALERKKSVLQSLWIPNLYFLGTTHSEEVLGIFSKLGRVLFYRNGTILLTDRLRLTLGDCEVQYKNFPFDRKLCKVRGLIYGEDADSVRMLGSSVIFDNGLSVIPGFNVEVSHLNEDNSMLFWKDRLFSVKGFDIELSRRSIRHILHYIIPNQIFVSITWLSFLIPFDKMGGRLGILLLCILSIRDTSQDTGFPSDYTAIGIWSLLCRLQILLCLLGYVIIIKLNSSLDEEDESPRFTTSTSQRNGGLFRCSTIEKASFQKRVKLNQIIYKIESKAIVLLPLVSVFINIGFWIHFLVANQS